MIQVSIHGRTREISRLQNVQSGPGTHLAS